MRTISPAFSSDMLIKRLQAFDFLQGLDAATLNRLAQNATWKVFSPDSVVFWEGDTESNLYFLHTLVLPRW